MSKVGQILGGWKGPVSPFFKQGFLAAGSYQLIPHYKGVKSVDYIEQILLYLIMFNSADPFLQLF